MNRTDRLYAIVEELRAVSPRLRTARELAARHGVSVRTVERDISALQQSGVPIYADVGRRGGYALEKSMSLPPLNFTAAEAVALAVAVARADGGPFADAGRSALRKILAAMSAQNAAAARQLALRVRLLESPEAVAPMPVPPEVEQAVVARRVLRIEYLDRAGVLSEREVEPVALLHGGRGWYLLGWCLLRDEPRNFRLDRMKAIELTGRIGPERSIETCSPAEPVHEIRMISLG
ncbi:helix-turn-helix transcriptional regulator [Nocardia sp. NPDC059764]|uniref:helix-turn-helix transcriptional regulator n=1 Tax=Nocardia sp. NPDC059764 TaxID=3346939 RepID=UPI003651ECBC